MIIAPVQFIQSIPDHMLIKIARLNGLTVSDQMLIEIFQQFQIVMASIHVPFHLYLFVFLPVFGDPVLDGFV